MLKLGVMRWSNAFSYGPNNKIDFSNSELVQLVGKNGHGKSSIALILEEVLYNKNSKGIKKANILNRYSKAKSYSIELEFSSGADRYEIKTSRGSTQTVKLIKNDEDISAHTATATYKLIEDIIGFDHKAFTQIVYQSNAFSLEFLTATDTNRKKFLIDLLRLTRYSEALEHYKLLAKDIGKDLEVLDTKYRLVSATLLKYSDIDLSPKDTLELPALDRALDDRLAELQEKVRTIETTNASIAKNNKYIEILSSINIENDIEKPRDITPLKITQSELEKRIATLEKAASGVVLTVCPSCRQPVDNSHKAAMIEEAKASLVVARDELDNIRKDITTLSKDISAYNSAVSSRVEWERYHSLINRSLPSEPLDKKVLEDEAYKVSAKIKADKAIFDSIAIENAKIASHNARVEVIKVELLAAQEEATIVNMHKTEKTARLSTIQLLVKTFSTSGLVAYKIECLVKDLEGLTNKYLADMSDGRFQLSFKISSSDKLDVIITDNGIDIDIAALSNGELARVNISTLLAIRCLMQSLGNIRINLLILDETVESLDVEGKEKLVEVLLKEEHLNTVLVSHGFSHPLLEKLSIIKEDNISRIEES